MAKVNYTATNFESGGAPLAAGSTIIFTPVLVPSGIPTAYQPGGGGIASASSISVNVTTAGNFSVKLDDTTATTPKDIGWAMTAFDPANLPIPLPGYGALQNLAGQDLDVDGYIPDLVSLVTTQVGPQGLQGANGVNGQVTNATLNDLLPSTTAAYGNIGPQTSDTNRGVYAFFDQVPVTEAGYLDSFEIGVSNFAAGAKIVCHVYAPSPTAPTCTVVASFTVAIAATGTNSYTRGVDFNDVQLAAGQFFGVETDATWSLQAASDNALPGQYNFQGSPGPGAQTYSGYGGNYLNIAFVIRSYPAVATAAAVASTTAALSASTAAVEAAIPQVVVPLGALPTSQANGTTSFNVFAQINFGAAAYSSYVTSIQIDIAAVKGTTSTWDFAVFALTSSGDYQVVLRYTLPARAAGVQTYIAGTDFPTQALPVAVGQFVGFVSSATTSITNGSNSTPGCYYYLAEPGTTPQSYNTGGSAGMLATIAGYIVPVDAVALAAGNVPIAPAAVSSMRGKNFAVMGYSLSDPNYQANGAQGAARAVWQNALAARFGMNYVYQDSQGGRDFANFFEAYPGLTLSNMGAVSTLAGATARRNPYTHLINGVAAYGATLAQDFANIDELVIWMGANDIGTYPVGNPLTDDATSNTFAGWVNNALSILYTAKPTLHVTFVGAYYSRYGGGSVASGTTIESTLAACGQNYGARLLPLLGTSGVNPLNWAVYLNPSDGPGPSQDHPSVLGEVHLAQVICDEF